MSEIRVEVDTRGLEQLAKNFEQVGKVAMLRLLEAGEELIREEAPERTGRLKGKRSAGGSVNSELIKLPNGYRGEINVSAIRERTNATSATAVSAKGTKKQIKLRAQNAFDYAEVVATGRPRLTAPKTAKAFLIPVLSAPSGQGYIIARGQIYIVRRSIGEQKPNDYPGRALKRLEPQIKPIVSKAIEDVLK